MGEIERLADRLSEAPEAAEDEVREAAEHYRDGLAVVGVPDAVVAPGAEEALARRGRWAWLLTLAIAPFALVGLVANAFGTIAVYLAHREEGDAAGGIVVPCAAVATAASGISGGKCGDREEEKSTCALSSSKSSGRGLGNPL